MHISELRCDQKSKRKDCWRVFVDDELITEVGEPIRPFDSVFYLFFQPPDRQSYGPVSIRSLGEYILWFNSVIQGYYGLDLDADPFNVRVFQRRQYAAAIGTTEEELRPSSLSSEEFHRMMWSRFPLRDEAIYTTPSLPNDPHGDHLIKRVYRHFFDVHPPTWAERVEVTEPPEQWGEIRIGLDRDGFPEAVWRVGKTPDGIGVWFVEYPSFPLWLCGEHVDRAFAPFIDSIMRQT